MPEPPATTDQGRRPEEQGSRPDPSNAGLLQSLEEAHAADHQLIDALGIKHPHLPILDVVQLLDHLRDNHVDTSISAAAERSSADPLGVAVVCHTGQASMSNPRAAYDAGVHLAPSAPW